VLSKIPESILVQNQWSSQLNHLVNSQEFESSVMLINNTQIKNQFIKILANAKQLEK
jgi:hypothetical protein